MPQILQISKIKLNAGRQALVKGCSMGMAEGSMLHDWGKVCLLASIARGGKRSRGISGRAKQKHGYRVVPKSEKKDGLIVLLFSVQQFRPMLVVPWPLRHRTGFLGAGWVLPDTTYALQYYSTCFLSTLCDAARRSRRGAYCIVTLGRLTPPKGLS